MSFDNVRTKVLNKASLHLHGYMLLDVHVPIRLARKQYNIIYQLL